MFEKGQPGGPGRPKGVRTIARVAEWLRQNQRHPIQELITLADKAGSTLKEREFAMNIWLAILPYVEAPQKDPTPLIPETSEQSVEAAQATLDKLAELSKPLEPINPQP